MNVRLLRKIKKHILAEPMRFVMFETIVRGKPGTPYTGDGGERVIFPNCGTAACIAGWACILGKNKNRQPGGVLSEAARLLKLDIYPDALFLEHQWPNPYRSRFLNAKTAKTRAEIAGDRIEHLIKHGQ